MILEKVRGVRVVRQVRVIDLAAVDLNVFVDVAVLVALQDVYVFVIVFEGALRLCFWLILWFCLCLGMVFW